MKLGKILGTALPLAAMFIPGVNAAVAGAMGAAGLGSLATPLGIGAVTGGLGAALRGDNILKGAATGGITAGLGGGLSQALKPVSAASKVGSAASMASTLDPVMAESINGMTPMGGVLKAAPNVAIETGKKNILPMLALGGLGLAMRPPKYAVEEEEENRNPNAGKERQDPRVIRRPPADFFHGGSAGEWMFFDPADTTGRYHYADGGSVVVEPPAPLYDPSQFAGLFDRPNIKAPTGPVGAYGQDWAPATPSQPVNPNPAPQPLPKTPANWADYGALNPDVAAEWGRIVDTGNAGNDKFHDDPNAYYQWHYNTYGKDEGRLAPMETGSPVGSAPYANLVPFANLDLKFASGGYVRGPGDGVSDSIPAIIDGHQPAKLSDGEYVIPAMAVAKLGNGSNEAGAKKLDKFVRGLARA